MNRQARYNAGRTIPRALSPSSSAEAARHNDPILGTVALAGMLVILGWAVTGLDFLAIVALVMAMGSFVVAVTLSRR